MKKLTKTLAGALLALAWMPTAASAQDLEAKYQEKLKAEFIEHGGWITDYDEARAKAKAEGKVLFVYFSRSYAP